MIKIKLEDGLLDGLEQFIADRDEPPRGKMTYDDAINVAVKDWLMNQGYIPLPEEVGEIVARNRGQ